MGIFSFNSKPRWTLYKALNRSAIFINIYDNNETITLNFEYMLIDDRTIRDDGFKWPRDIEIIERSDDKSALISIANAFNDAQETNLDDRIYDAFDTYEVEVDKRSWVPFPIFF